MNAEVLREHSDTYRQLTVPRFREPNGAKFIQLKAADMETEMSDQQTPYEDQKWVHEQLRDEARRAHDNHNSLFNDFGEAAIKSSELTLRTAVIINGGAAISVLAFIGGLVGQGKIAVGQIGAVADSLTRFAWGVAAATSGMALSYLVHYLTQAICNSQTVAWEHPYILDGTNTKWWVWARHTVHALAIIAAIASILLFVVGMFDVKNAIALLKPEAPMHNPQ